MSAARAATAPVRHPDRLFIDGAWVESSSDATIDVIDSGTEEVYYRVVAAGPDDMSRAVGAARRAFDEGPWPRMSHTERADVLRAFAAGIGERGDVLGQLWPRETGTIFKNAQYATSCSAVSGAPSISAATSSLTRSSRGSRRRSAMRASK